MIYFLITSPSFISCLNWFSIDLKTKLLVVLIISLTSDTTKSIKSSIVALPSFISSWTTYHLAVLSKVLAFSRSALYNSLPFSVEIIFSPFNSIYP